MRGKRGVAFAYRFSVFMVVLVKKRTKLVERRKCMITNKGQQLVWYVNICPKRQNRMMKRVSLSRAQASLGVDSRRCQIDYTICLEIIPFKYRITINCLSILHTPFYLFIDVIKCVEALCTCTDFCPIFIFYYSFDNHLIQTVNFPYFTQQKKWLKWDYNSLILQTNREQFFLLDHGRSIKLHASLQIAL